MLELADTSLILINPSPSNVKAVAYIHLKTISRRFFSENYVLFTSFIPLCYTGAGDPRNHPVIYGNMYFWQLRYHAKIATPLWDIHKPRPKKYRVRLNNSDIIKPKKKESINYLFRPHL